MVLNPLKEDKDVRWIDPDTGEAVCTYNTCRQKFDQVTLTHTYTFNTHKDDIDGPTKDLEFYFHVCQSCNRKLISQTDTIKTKENYRDFKHPKTREELPSFDKDRTAIQKIQKKMYDEYDPQQTEDDGFITVHPSQHYVDRDVESPLLTNEQYDKIKRLEND